MCTLIVLRQVLPDRALIVASNRDEYLARPAAPPQLIETGVGEPFVAPQDLEAGGTWIGVNAAGLFIGLTNRVEASDPAVSHRVDSRSRGLLVRDLLQLDSVDAVREHIARIGPRLLTDRECGMEASSGPYRPFHLVAIDPIDGCRVRHTSDGPPVEEPLPDGVHVICNRDAGCSKVEWVHSALAAVDLGAPVERVLSELREILSAHPFGTSSIDSPCIHRDGYGTRSSTLFFRMAAGWQGWHAEGPPCRTPYQCFTPMLERLQAAA